MIDKKCENCIWFDKCHEGEACDNYEPSSLEEQEALDMEECVCGGNIMTLGDKVSNIAKLGGAGLFVTHWRNEISRLTFFHNTFDLFAVLGNKDESLIRSFVHHVNAGTGLSAST